MRHSLKQQKDHRQRVSFACMILTVICFLAFSALIFYLFYMQYVDPTYLSDLHHHIEFAKTGESLYSLTYILLGFFDSLPHPALWLAAFRLAFQLLGVCATKKLLQFLMPQQDKWIVWIYAWMVNMVFPLLIPYIPYLGQMRFKGVFNFNIYHNPTYGTMKPVAIMCVYYFMKLMKQYADKGMKVLEWLIFAGLMLLATAFKPNFIVGFSLSILCVLIYDFIKRRGKHILRFIAMGTTVFPSVLLVVYQQSTVFNSNSQMQIGFLVGLKAMTKYPAITMLETLAFPLLILVFVFRDLFKDKFYAFAWLHMLVNMGITCFLYESGYRLIHGNFIWGSYFAYGILLMASVYKLNQLIEEKRQGCVVAGSALLGMHLFSWFNYLCEILHGGKPF